MPLSDQQWNEFLKAAKRLSLTASAKRCIVIDVAGNDSDDDPWASFSAIHGTREFIKEIYAYIRKSEAREQIVPFLIAILSYTHNEDDKKVFERLIQDLEAGIGSASEPLPQKFRTFPTHAEPTAMSKPDVNPIDYIDFDIHLTSYDSGAGTKVFASLDCRESSGEEIISLPQPCDLSALANLTVFNPMPQSNLRELIEYGNQIYSKVFTGELGRKLGIAQGRKPNLIRIGISRTGVELPNHLWELICKQCNSDLFLSLDPEHSVARIVKHDRPSNLRRLDGPIKILIGHASPSGTANIPVEHLDVYERKAKNHGHETKILPALGFNRIQNLFDTVPNERFDVVHLICHGKVLEDSPGVLVFQDAQGNKQKIEPSVLAQVLKRVAPALVILQACHTGDTSSNSEFITGVAESLVLSGIPAVLAFRGKPHIDFAFEFLSRFYDVWLQGDSSFEYALQQARITIRNSQSNSKSERPIDAWSLPVLYRQPRVFLKIENKSGPGPDPEVDPPSDPNDALAQYIIIILKSQPKILKSIKDFLIREKLIDATNPAQSATEVDLIASRLITPRPNSSESTRCAIFLQMLTDSKHRGYRFSDEEEKNALRGIRDCVFLASLPDMHTRGMKNAIKNAIQMTRPEGSSSAEVPVLDMDIAMKIGRYAHALVIDEMARKTGDQSFVFQLLNKQFDSDDTSIFFEDRYYSYEVIKEPKEYRNKTKPKERKESFAKGCRLEGYDPKFPKSYTETLNSHLQTRFGARHLVFVLADKPADDDEKEILQEVMDEFRRMVFIQASPDGNATIYEDIMREIAEIDKLLHKLFSN